MRLAVQRRNPEGREFGQATSEYDPRFDKGEYLVEDRLSFLFLFDMVVDRVLLDDSLKVLVLLVTVDRCETVEVPLAPLRGGDLWPVTLLLQTGVVAY